MAKEIQKHAGESPFKRYLFFFLLLFLTLFVCLAALFLPQINRQVSSEFKVGEVSTREVVAPRALTFQSEILTQSQQENAAQAILPIYSSPDTQIARNQMENLRAALAYISSVRADTYATPQQKLTDLAALEDIHLSQETAQSILDLSDTRWQSVQQETVVVLEQVMRANIREDRLEDVRRNIPTLVSLSLPEDQATIVTQLVSGFVTPNSFYSEDLTETARQKARQSVQPVERQFALGETIIQRGQVIDRLDIEALQKLGLVNQPASWRDYLGPISLSLLVILYFSLYLRRNPTLRANQRGILVVMLLFLVFLLPARLLVISQPGLAYLYPLAGFSLVVTALFGVQTALVFSFPLCILFAYGTPDFLDLAVYSLFTCFCGSLAIGKARRMASFFYAAASITIAGVASILATSLLQPGIELVSIFTLSGMALVNGIASSSLAVLLQYLLAQFLGVTTAMQLMEFARPDHPLLQLMLRNAPGTYQHSLQVANLAEQAAEKVGADTLLTRVGAIYHDAGKALNPSLFIENQLPGSPNPHDTLPPTESASLIIQHVIDGQALAQKYRLPRQIQAFITEHHGTMLARYQYVRAVEQAGGDESQVDETLFRYPGPRPRSRETAILMLADGSEARVRAVHPEDEKALREVIKGVVENRLSSGQLDETDLTLNEIDQIIDSFTTTLRGIYHPRLEYPEMKPLNRVKSEEQPTIPIISRKSAEQSITSSQDT